MQTTDTPQTNQKDSPLVGIDLTEISSFSGTSPIALRESFSPAEIAYADTRPDPSGSLAAAWSAKEAFCKALGVGIASGWFAPHQIELVHDTSGRPRLQFSQAIASRVGFSADQVNVSLSHQSGVAAAVVTLPAEASTLAALPPMAKTGGIKNYEKRRADIIELLCGADAAEAPPAPHFHGSGEAFDALMALGQEPEFAPLFAFARRCGLEFRVVEVHPEAYENLDNAEESNDFRKLAPYAQLHFLALTVDAESYGAFAAETALAEGARGAVLINQGLLEGPEELADARRLLLASELQHEVAHFEDPTFRSSEIQAQWIEETCGLARQLARLAGEDALARARAEALVTDTLEKNPIKESFDLELGDGTSRRIASKTFIVLEMELAEVQRAFGTLTPDGMNPALFRLLDRLLDDEELYLKSEQTFADAGLEAVLKFATEQDRDLRSEVKRDMGVQLQELIVPADGAAKVRAALERVEKLIAGEIEPDFPAPELAAPAGAAASEAGDVVTVAADPYAEEKARRFDLQAPTPARKQMRRLSLMLRARAEAEAFDVARSADEIMLDCDELFVSTEEKRELVERGLKRIREAGLDQDDAPALAVRVPRGASDTLRELVGELKAAVSSVAVEVEDAQELWRVEDELLALEEPLGLPLGSIGIQLLVESPAALVNIDRLVGATPRICAVELGETLPAQLGWVFRAREGESLARMRSRRIEEAEDTLAGLRARLTAVCRANGVTLLRGPIGPQEALGTESIAQLVRNYDGLRVIGADMGKRVARALTNTDYEARIETLEAAAQSKVITDPAPSLRLREDLRVLGRACAESLLTEGQLRRYWRARWALLYDKGVAPSIQIPDKTLSAALRDAAENNPERSFLYHSEVIREGGKRGMLSASVPFAQLLGPDACRVAGGLRQLGVEKGDRIAISTSNTLANVAAFQGAAMVGAVIVPLDPTKAHLADRFFNDAQIKLLVFDPGSDQDDAELHFARIMAWVRENDLEHDPVLMEALRKARRKLNSDESEQVIAELQALLPRQQHAAFAALWRAKLTATAKFCETLPLVPSLKHVILAGSFDFSGEAGPSHSEAVDTLKAVVPNAEVTELMALVSGQSETFDAADVGGADALAWPYTGGTTTGVSKAAIHTHRSMLALGLQRGLSMIPDGHVQHHVVSTTLPFTHTYGFATGVLTPVLTGADAVVIPNTGPRYLSMIAEGLVEHRTTVLFSSRSALGTLARLIPETADLSSIQRIASSGDTLTPAVVDVWRKRFNATPCSGYGSTETPSSLMNPRRTNRYGTEGIPVPNVEARVVDAQTGAPLPPGSEGLLQIRGPHVASGYANRPDADAKVMKPGGWWQKDDIFKMDADGYFIFCGRADDMFTVNELNVYPETVEQALLSLDEVKECGVIGVFDENLGTNRVKAFVVPAPGADVTPESVMEAARSLLEAHETPTLIEIAQSLDKSNFGKLARSQLRKREAGRSTAKNEARDAAKQRPLAPPPIDADHTLLVFPTGGSHFPGMGGDFALDASADQLARIDDALVAAGVKKGALTSLMQGSNQAERVQTAEGWTWRGDFPLSVAAQTAVSVILGERFVAEHGGPVAVVGESMGELAAYAIAGALSPENAVLTAYKFADALAQASDALDGLRMAVVENINEERLTPILGEVDGTIVIREAEQLFVVGLPQAQLAALEQQVTGAGGRALVSNNPCAAHHPKLPQAEEVWQSYQSWLDSLTFETPKLRLLSTLDAGTALSTPKALAENLKRTISEPVAWRATIAAQIEGDKPATTLVQLGANTRAYALEKLAEAREENLRIESVGSLGELQAIDLLPGRGVLCDPTEVDGARIRGLAQASGDRNSYHLDHDYAARTQYGAVILHGVGSQGLVLAEIGRRFPHWEVRRSEVTSFKQAVKVGDSVRPMYTVAARDAAEIELDLGACNQWGDLLFDGKAWLSPRRSAVAPEVPEIDLAAFGADVKPFEPRDVPEFNQGDSGSYAFDLTAERAAATLQLFPGGDAAYASTLGIELVSYASACFAPGYILTGTRLVDVRRAAQELRATCVRAGVSDDAFATALADAESVDAFLESLGLTGKAAKQLRRHLPSSIAHALDPLLVDQADRKRLAAAPGELSLPNALTVSTLLEKLEGSAPNRAISIAIEVRDKDGFPLFRGGVNKSEAPPDDSDTEPTPAEEVLAQTLVQQKIINVFPVTRPRDAENSAADPAVNAALVDLEDAVSPTMRDAARPRAVDMFSKVRRDSVPAKKGLIAALQTARARLKRPNLAEVLLDPEVVDLESLLERLEFRKRGAEDFRGAMRKPQLRLLKAYLATPATRRALIDSVGHLDFGGKVLKLRPNNVRTTAAAADYHQVIHQVGNRVDALTIPKTRYPDEIVTIDRVLTAIEADRGWPMGRLKLELLIEHPLAITQIDQIAAASPRIISLIYGHVDYVAATGGWDQNFQFEFQRYAKQATIRAAHNNGQIAIDAITPAIDMEAAKRDAEQSVELGFDGKWSIHLEHIAGIRQVPFPPPTLRLQAHRGAALFANGPFDLSELAKLAAAGAPLVPGALPEERQRPVDLRAMLRVPADRLADANTADLVFLENAAATDLAKLAKSDVRAGAVLDAGNLDAAVVAAAREHNAAVLLEGVSGAITAQQIADAASALGDAPLYLSVTRAEELEGLFDAVSSAKSVVGLVHSVGATEEHWSTAGHLLAIATALRLDAIQGVDTRDSADARRRSAFRGAHMGLRGQLTADPAELDVLRQAYAPPTDLIAESAAVVERYYKAERIEHVGAIPYEFTYLLERPTRGLVDAATAKIFDAALRRGHELNLLNPAQLEAYRSYTLRYAWKDSGEEVDFTRWRWDGDDVICKQDSADEKARLGEQFDEVFPD